MSDNKAGTGVKPGTGMDSRAIVITALAALVGFAAVYVTLGGRDNARTLPTSTAKPTAVAPASPVASPVVGKLNVGHMAGFVLKAAPEPLAEVSFNDGEGRPKTLADWKGRVVLLNLWATWCAPCRKEMPDLARLQKALGSDQFEVVALAVDRAGAEAARKFLGSIEARELALYIDATARAGTALKAVGMPTTILVDRQGREVGRLTGPAEWDSDDAKRLVQAFLR